MTGPDDVHGARARLDELAELRRGTTTADALAFFDTLPPADVDAVVGRWRGAGLPTGHRLDGVLEELGWVGKRFDGVRDAHHSCSPAPGAGRSPSTPRSCPSRSSCGAPRSCGGPASRGSCARRCPSLVRGAPGHGCAPSCTAAWRPPP
ncbi:GXWXG domain-containing protein [Cellulosimicrobium cellulans]|nr:GXWXG domain-containing protein [Cellulosimicrobium cellulans]